ncbi:hypothetical protein Nepgr_027217 [Nepenthes gracilis]|uniref:Uncharacterized protein n=1 Tax=Nepenthes gracilis TaxID=150966 RepID=A0AAD3T9Y0_NEPGR|nr:hypothetical protein Nepgr_027217 [Nepenthes gracilis]
MQLRPKHSVLCQWIPGSPSISFRHADEISLRKSHWPKARRNLTLRIKHAGNLHSGFNSIASQSHSGFNVLGYWHIPGSIREQAKRIPAKYHLANSLWPKAVRNLVLRIKHSRNLHSRFCTTPSQSLRPATFLPSTPSIFPPVIRRTGNMHSANSFAILQEPVDLDVQELQCGPPVELTCEAPGAASGNKSVVL